jgi:hypothetical protein
MKKLLILVLGLFPILIFCQSKKVDSVRVFYLGGQSNMDGHGYTKEVPKSLNTTFKNVWIYHGNPVRDNVKKGGLGIWEELKPGHGKGFLFDGIKNKLSNRFGVELSFAEKLQSLYPGQKIAIIKYSMGGTSIDSTAARNKGSWDSDFNGMNQYDNFLKTVQLALETSDIDKNGIEDTLIPSGIIWMQGESDALFKKSAENYFNNLKKLLNLMRASFRNKKLPIVLGKISDSGSNSNTKALKYSKLVQLAQERFSSYDKYTSIVRKTNTYKYIDTYHYNSKGYLDLGVHFAIEIYKLNNKI